MSDTTKLVLPIIEAAQAQKHVTHNEALRLLDGIVQLSVIDRDLTAPPGSPSDGDRYIIASGATGDWADSYLNVALYTDGAWAILAPRAGWRAWVEDEGLLLVYDGSGWNGLTVDNATGTIEQPELPRFKAYTNYNNYVDAGSWTKIGINNTDYNDQGAFDTANNRFVAPMDGTYLFGATLLYKKNSSNSARMRGRLVLNGTDEIRGSMGESSATHFSQATAIWPQTMVVLSKDDTVELQGYFRSASGYFAADHTSFWGTKIG